MPDVATISPQWRIHFAKFIDIVPIEIASEETSDPIQTDTGERKFNIPKCLVEKGITDSDLIDVENGVSFNIDMNFAILKYAFQTK